VNSRIVSNAVQLTLEPQDVVVSAASVAQLLGQVISLIQGIQRVRETVHRYPKLLEDQFRQLDDLCHTLELVEQEKELQTASVVDQVTRMHEIPQELHAFPDETARWSIRIAVR
jgi:hypothetical protein